MSELIIRPARSDEVDTLSVMAQSAKRHWGYAEHWIEVWRAELTVTAAYVDEHAVYVAERNGEPVGFYALRDLGDRADLDHFWVDPDHMGRGYGSVMFEHAACRARERGAREMLIDADPNAAGFYERVGAEPCGSVPAPTDDVDRTRPQYRLALTDSTG